MRPLDRGAHVRLTKKAQLQESIDGEAVESARKDTPAVYDQPHPDAPPSKDLHVLTVNLEGREFVAVVPRSGFLTTEL